MEISEERLSELLESAFYDGFHTDSDITAIDVHPGMTLTDPFENSKTSGVIEGLKIAQETMKNG